MAFKFQLYDKISACLRSNPEKRFTADAIARWIFEHYPEDCKQKQADSGQDLRTDAALIGQISREVSARSLSEKNKQIKYTADRPRQYYWQEKTDEQPIIRNKPAADKANHAAPSRKEADLYPLLAEFLLSEFKIHSRRIDEKTSDNKRGRDGNKWLHPDMVGLEDLSRDWCAEIKACAPKAFSEHFLLWSFEVKLRLSRSNIRESFFQALSNSSWAHYGYLVAAEIDKKCEQELQLLANAHNIGVIRLDADAPAKSEILIPADTDREIDWNTANRIAEVNNDFRKYLICVKEVYNGSDIANQKGWLSYKK